MTKKPRILLVEDDPDVLGQMEALLGEEGYGPVRAQSAEEGLAALDRQPVNAVITDLHLPGTGGLDLLSELHSRFPDLPVLIVTGYGSVDSAVEAMKRGAFHYLVKPISGETLLIQLGKALEFGAALRERSALRETLSRVHGVGLILGESAAMTALRGTIKRVAEVDAAVLVAGETGTGKELVADALHFESRRAGGPLVKVNCAAISESLLESELFGHEKGAFTGADRLREGKIKRADGGTLFLDEITEMGAGLQAKLLRVLQGSDFERVGGNEPIRSDFRLVAATNRDPEKAVEAGRLREDLFFRLNVIRIQIPPLRDRPGDIPPLAEHFLRAFAAKHGKPVEAISGEAIEALKAHPWPGNVRELENAISRGVALADGKVISREDLDLGGDRGPGGPERKGAPRTLNLQELERLAILRALAETEWNKVRAAEILGIYPSSLYKKMRRFGIPKSPPP